MATHIIERHKHQSERGTQNTINTHGAPLYRNFKQFIASCHKQYNLILAISVGKHEDLGYAQDETQAEPLPLALQMYNSV